MSKPTVAIIGASNKREKYSNKSVRAHLQQGYHVYPVNPHEQQVEGLSCYGSIADVPEPLDRVSIYVPPDVGITLLEDIAAKNPQEVWLNPGAESEAILRRARELKLRVIAACSIVDLGVTPAQFGQ